MLRGLLLRDWPNRIVCLDRAFGFVAIEPRRDTAAVQCEDRHDTSDCGPTERIAEKMGAAGDALNGDQGGNDFLTGTNGSDTLNARGGNDILLGLGGNDTLTGGTGNDRFIFNNSSGHDTIMDFVTGGASDDVIELRGVSIADFDELIAEFATYDGADTTIHLSATASIRLVGIDIALLHRDDFVFVA